MAEFLIISLEINEKIVQVNARMSYFAALHSFVSRTETIKLPVDSDHNFFFNFGALVYIQMMLKDEHISFSV